MIDAPKEKITIYTLAMEPERVELPFVDNATVRAGFPSPAMDYLQRQIDLNEVLIKNRAATVLVRTEGDSMIGSFIPESSLLIVDKSWVPENEDIVVAVLNGEFTVKHFVRKNGHMYLVPGNKKYRPIQIIDGMDFSIWGTVTSIIIDMREVKKYAMLNRL